MIYIFKARVVDVKELTTRHHTAGFGEHANFEEHASGWRVSFLINNSRIGIELSFEPEFVVGDIVRFTLEKEPNE